MIPWESMCIYRVWNLDTLTEGARLEISTIWVDDARLTIVSEAYRKSIIDTIDYRLCCASDELFGIIGESTRKIPLDIMSCDEEGLHREKVKRLNVRSVHPRGYGGKSSSLYKH
jgi:hypothetical protein